MDAIAVARSGNFKRSGKLPATSLTEPQVKLLNRFTRRIGSLRSGHGGASRTERSLRSCSSKESKFTRPGASGGKGPRQLYFAAEGAAPTQNCSMKRRLMWIT